MAYLALWLTLFAVIGCTVDGSAGNGTAQGTCDSEFFCHADGACKLEGL